MNAVGEGCYADCTEKNNKDPSLDLNINICKEAEPVTKIHMLLAALYLNAQACAACKAVN